MREVFAPYFKFISNAGRKPEPIADQERSWHSMEETNVFSDLDASIKGLSSTEVKSRADKYGLNRLPESSTHGPLYRFLYQFHNVLIYVLLASGLVVAVLGHWIDAGVIMAVVVVNALIGFIQEGKAEDALRAIRQMLSPKAMVLRDAQRQSIVSDELVPGDVVFLQSGDKVPADLRLFHIKSLQIQEAVLTGESLAVEKNTVSLAEDTELGDRTCMAYSGTLVTYGQGSGLVVATGAGTQIGQISSLLAGVKTLTTPLVRQISQFARWLTTVIIVFASATFFFGIGFRDYPASEMFLAAVGLAVAAIPEGLPAIMTITLSIGVQRMAHRHAIIRRLPAVETLGAVTLICSDKTGTLTRNEMTVKAIATATDFIEVTGVGYNPHGAFLIDGDELILEKHPVLNELIYASLLCNDATLHEEVSQDSALHKKEEDGREQWVLSGDPTEGALLTMAIKAGLNHAYEQKAWPRTDVIPFESEHRFMATLHHDHAGNSFAYIKGAPEQLLEMCNSQRNYADDVPIDHNYWQAQILAMARLGQRVLAIACKPMPQNYPELKFSDFETGLTLLGIVGMIDPPREDALKRFNSVSQQVYG